MESTALSPEVLARIEANRQAALTRKQKAEEARNKNHYKVQDGVVHLKQILQPHEQVQLYADIAAGAKKYAARQARNAKSNFKKILTYDWVKDAERVPESFERFSALACSEASTVCAAIPQQFQPNYVTAFAYPEKDGRLTGHVDKVLGWVVLFSLGCTAKFWIKGPQMRQKKVIDFESGDVLVFNGATEYGIQHGIDTIVADSCPAHLTADLAHSRISLQFRQTLRNDNVKKWSPKNKN